jgi:hypothetical protein
MEVRVTEARHIIVSQVYDPARGKFVPASELADDVPLNDFAGGPKVLAFAWPTEKRGRFAHTSDVKGSPVYDACGYLIPQQRMEFEELETLAKRLGLQNYQVRCYIHGIGGQLIMPCLHTFAGQQTELKFGSMIDKWAASLSRKEGVEAEVIGDKTVSIWIDEEEG